MKITKIIAAIMMMAIVATCFAGCGKKEASSTIEYGEIQTEAETESTTTQEQEGTTTSTTTKTHAEVPSDYELPAAPEVIVYQGDKEVFHYAGETTSEVKSMLKDMGVGDNGKVIKDYRLTVKVSTNNIKLDVNKLTDDMRVVIDGLEVNLDTMNAIASDGVIITDTSEWKPEDFKTKPYAKLKFIVSGNTGNVTGCIIQLNNVPEN